eukprot:jgi/Ulvmu1/410/UM001_0417.1
MATALSYALCNPRVFARAQRFRLCSLKELSTAHRLGARSHVRTFASSTSAPAGQATGAPSNGSRRGDAPSFQEAIFRLQQFWSSRGCVVWLPHNTEVGAGTMNPATFLRVLGPEPWNVSYPEPSVRPDDSRYGLNPNRVQRHTQFQVILKPDPGNPQELYLQSLEALGIDTRAHDVRFVEDNWESPALGAWGLGWEVWLDGMEVTQFTYFQQCGSQVLQVPAVEITYGLERILMALQGVDHFKDIRFAEGVTYGELFMQNEYEMSVFNLDAASTDSLREHFALFEKETERLLERRLPVPAYDHILKLSHTFNLLDARGAVGFTERQDNFARMRGLARQVSTLYQERRAELEHPLGVVAALPEGGSGEGQGNASQDAAEAKGFVLEIGTEEIPPAELNAVLEQLKTKAAAMLADCRLSHKGIEVLGTPRRMVVCVRSLEPRQEMVTEERRGPPRSRAYGDDGSPTKALLGFCRGCGVDIETVFFKEDQKGTEYCYVSVEAGGRSATAVLAKALPGLVTGLAFSKSMRWEPHSDLAFSRPLRWLLALHGDVHIPFSVGSLRSGSTTRLLRTSAQPTASVAATKEYASLLAAEGIILGVGTRRNKIWEEVTQAAEAEGGHVPENPDLLDEVTNLVEAPTVIRGTFSEEFLRLPPDVLVMTMRKHQRYFPVYAGAGSGLTNAFVTVANGPVDVDVTRRGNEAVLRARFEDAAFFYDDDLKQPLAEFVLKLAGTLFHRELGSMLDKSRREAALVPQLAGLLGLEGARAAAEQAMGLAKADLATSVVTEMTSLAGVMGRHYAEKEGLPEDVALAIYESVLPRSANDDIPSSPAGVLASAADKLDALVGLAAAGCLPTASADRYGLRRVTYGLLQTLIGNGVRASMRAAVAAAAELQPVAAGEDVQRDVVEFVSRRLEQLILDDGVPAEAARAVLNEQSDDVARAVASARELAAELRAGDASPLPAVTTALSRPTRLVRGKDAAAGAAVDEALLSCEEERRLWEVVQAVKGQLHGEMGVKEWVGVVSAVVGPVDEFFTNVLVMADDDAVRANRLALSQEVASVSEGFVDLAELPGF